MKLHGGGSNSFRSIAVNKNLEGWKDGRQLLSCSLLHRNMPLTPVCHRFPANYIIIFMLPDPDHHIKITNISLFLCCGTLIMTLNLNYFIVFMLRDPDHNIKTSLFHCFYAAEPWSPHYNYILSLFWCCRTLIATLKLNYLIVFMLGNPYHMLSTDFRHAPASCNIRKNFARRHLIGRGS